MAKWKSQQYYTVQLQDVLTSIIELVEDTNVTIGPKWYWGGQRDTTVRSGKVSGTVISLTEDVLPIIYRRKDNKLMALLPIQTVMDFEKETQLKWQNGLSAQTLITRVNSIYLS